MVERQPGRPSEHEFIGAARRFQQNQYKTELITASSMVWSGAHYSDGGRKHDIAILNDEMKAEGLFGEPETLEQFVTRQISRYQKLGRG